MFEFSNGQKKSTRDLFDPSCFKTQSTSNEKLETEAK